MLTAIGGGMTRDVLLSEIPTVLRADLYAVAALAGAVVVVIGAVTAPLDRGDDCRRAPLFWAPVHGHSPRLAPHRLDLFGVLVLSYAAANRRRVRDSAR